MSLGVSMIKALFPLDVENQLKVDG
jgi:hypothetical protein